MDNGFSKVFDYMTEALGKAYGEGISKAEAVPAVLDLGFGEQWNRKYGYGVVVQIRPGSQCPFSTLSRRPRPTAIRWSNRMTAPSGSHRCKRKKVYSSTCALS
jgi:hypothetical protein